MSYSAKVLLDSVSPAGSRLTTMEVTFPRFILPEVNTHRMFSRNSASSRAIPVKKLIDRVRRDPFIPDYWGANQAGMQASVELQGWRRWVARQTWWLASRGAVALAKFFNWLGLHKQLTNRVLEPFAWHTVLISSTEWANFFALRAHPDAQPEIQTLAKLMIEAYNNSTPKLLMHGEWHLPLVPDFEDLFVLEGHSIEDIKKISAGRCARVSYLTHDGEHDPEKDIELCERLVASGHMSPMEHVARPSRLANEFYGNFKGWLQMRKGIPNEHNFGAREVQQ